MFNKPTQIALACASICTIYSAHSTAQTSLEPVVVIASGVEQPLSKVLPSASVITRADLDRSQAKTLVDALQGEPGFEFGRNGGPGGTTSIFLRGSDSKNIVVMIDGVRSQTDNLGSLQITDIPLSAVERIEILRGNAGALYGESAIGGVINIITKSGKGDPKANATLTYGSRNTSETAIGYSGEVNQTRFAINASRFDTDGFSAKRPGNGINPDRDGYTNESISGKISHQLKSGTEFGLTTQIVRGKTAFDKTSGTDSDIFRNSTDNVGIYGMTNLSANLRTRLDILSSSFTYKDFTNGLPIQYYGVQEGSQVTYRWSNFFELSENQQITFGVDRSQAKYNVYQFSSTLDSRNDRDSRGVYLGTLKKIGNLDLQANLRRDQLDAQKLGARVNEYQKNTYLLGLGYQLSSRYRLTATNSTGFRAPSPAEYTSNSNLRPETNKSSEFGILYSDVTSSLRLVYFDTRASDALYYNPYAGRFGAYQNMNVKNNGVEISGRKVIGNTTVKISMTKQDPVNTDVNLQQARRAQEFGSLDINQQIGRYQFGGLIFWAGTRVDRDTNRSTTPATYMPAYTVLNLYGSYKIDKEWTARLRLENIADTQYELASGYNTPGRGIFMTLQYQGR